MGQLPVAEQVGVDPRVRRRGAGGPRLGGHRLDAPQPPEPLDPLAVDRRSRRSQGHRQPPAAVERGLEERLVDPPPEPRVLLRRGGRGAVSARSVEIQEFALATNAQLRMISFDKRPLLVNRGGQGFFSAIRSPC
jgi:hypothetical protein